MSEPESAGHAASDDIVFGERPVQDGRVIGLVLLNRPSKINAISASMFTALNSQLDRWECDQSVVAIGIAGAGDRGFGAGGDVVSLYRNSQQMNEEDAGVAAEAFFSAEYRADARLHTWRKPVISLAHGICMGGGLGLARAASHRVVTNDVRIAMPEVHIGFFPDVGACAFLQDLPPGLGRVMAVTGVSIGVGEALQSGMATALLGDGDRALFWDRLGDLEWTGDAGQDDERVGQFLAELTTQQGGGQASQKLAGRDLLAELAGAPDAGTFIELLQRQAQNSSFLTAASSSVAAASPGSVVLADCYFGRSSGRSAGEVLERDQVLAMRRIHDPDFNEGVRSVLVDKSSDPRWLHKTVGEVSEDYIDQLLQGC